MVSIGDVYREHYAHFRAMNDTLYKMPPLFTAVIGGLWYFATQNLAGDRWLARALFLFAAIASACFVNVMARFRQAFGGYLDNLNKLDGDLKVTTKGGGYRMSTITTIQLLLSMGAVVSAFGIMYSFYK
jgi:hypothetical protein